MQYIQIFILVFVILAVVVGLSIQEIAQPDSSLAEGPEIVEAGGKIIGVNLHDGIKGSLGNDGPEIVEAGGKIIGVNLHDGIKGSLGNG